MFIHQKKETTSCRFFELPPTITCFRPITILPIRNQKGNSQRVPLMNNSQLYATGLLGQKHDWPSKYCLGTPYSLQRDKNIQNNQSFSLINNCSLSEEKVTKFHSLSKSISEHLDDCLLRKTIKVNKTILAKGKQCKKATLFSLTVLSVLKIFSPFTSISHRY